MLVRESVNFIRGDRDEESVKTSLFGIRVGHIVIPSKLPPFPNSRSGVTMPAYLVESIHDEGRKRSLRLLGIGYFYNLNFRNPGDTPSQWFSFSSGFSSSLGDEEDYKPIDSILKEMILDSLKKEPERRTWEVHKMNFYDRSGGKPILLKEELFHRSSTKSQIKDKLIGFRPGSIITSTEPWPANKPYKEVYMYIKKGEKFNDQGNPIIVTYIGALSKRDGKLSQFLIRHKKMLGETVIWEENKRSLTPEELQKVQKTFAEIPNYRKKIYDETGIKPSLNESINFERGLDPKHSMKIGKRGLIIKWFSDLGIDESRYEILPDLSIKVNGNLDLSNTQITSLPDNLTIGGDLYLRNTQITSLPDNLTIGGDLYLNNTPITSLPDNLSVGRWLDLRNTQIISLPDNLTVGGNLYLSNTQITSLPDNLTVGGSLYLSNTQITSLPDNLSIGRDLDLNNTPITSLPDNLTVGGSLYLSNTQITSLPDNLSIGESLFLSNTQITSLPDNLSVGGGLYLNNSPITSLPDNLSVGRNLDLSNTQITSLPPSLKVKGKIIGFKERIVKESLNFERGVDPKHSMKIGKKALIIKWFSDLGIDESRYEILPDFSIKIGRYLNLSNTQITSLPDNLSVGGDLNLSNTPITTLPDNLTVGGWLDLSNTSITSLPDNLTVGRWLDLRNTQIISLPDNLTVGGNLYLSNTPITSLPDNLSVGGSLDLENTPITSLPDNISVGGSLYLSNTKITSLPDNLTVGGNLNLSNTPITSLPDNLTVGGNLNLSNTPITSLPDNISVGGDLNLIKTKITSLPDNISVGGDLNLINTKITSLPPSLKVRGQIIGFKGKIVKESLEFHRTYSEAEIKEKLFGWRSGQILIYNTERKHGVTKLFVYNETLESDDVLKPWDIQCMEIGHMGGNPKYAYIHVGFFPSLTIKREKDLRIPNLEEREVIKKALKKEYYKKEIKKIEEKLGVRIFV